ADLVLEPLAVDQGHDLVAGRAQDPFHHGELGVCVVDDHHFAHVGVLSFLFARLAARTVVRRATTLQGGGHRPSPSRRWGDGPDALGDGTAVTPQRRSTGNIP